MSRWHRQIQQLIDEIEECIRSEADEELTLNALSEKSGVSQFHLSRKFREITGMQLRDYLRFRRLALALKEVRDTDQGILDIALKYGFSSHEAFTRAFKEAYGVSPSEYRKNPVPVMLRTIIRPLDCWLIEKGEIGMNQTNGEVKTYFVTIPAHKFLHIRNYESIGYWDFCQKSQ